MKKPKRVVWKGRLTISRAEHKRVRAEIGGKRLWELLMKAGLEGKRIRLVAEILPPPSRKAKKGKGVA